MPNHTLSLTIWIPTFERCLDLRRLLDQLNSLQIHKYVKIIVSDNGSDPHLFKPIVDQYSQTAEFICRSHNLSGGANFLRAFEVAQTEWLHILSDDELLSSNYLETISNTLAHVDPLTCAIKYDSALFGCLPDASYQHLYAAIQSIPPSKINDWFNNLLLISGWVFKRTQCLRYIKSGYIGHCSKMPHILPALNCCQHENNYIFFSSSQPIIYGNPATTCWPKAATWTEMTINIATGYGYLSANNRKAILTCLLCGDYSRLVAKVLRIRLAYTNPDNGPSWPTILSVLCTLSFRVSTVAILLLPILILPARLWPQSLTRALGPAGSVDRW